MFLEMLGLDRGGLNGERPHLTGQTVSRCCVPAQQWGTGRPWCPKRQRAGMEKRRSSPGVWPCRWCHQQGLNAEGQLRAQLLPVGVGGGNSPLLLAPSQFVHTHIEKPQPSCSAWRRLQGALIAEAQCLKGAMRMMKMGFSQGHAVIEQGRMALKCRRVGLD